MGRLFWKFFIAFWLALLIAGGGVGTAVWWRHNNLEQRPAEPDALITDRHADVFVGAAAGVLQHGGVAALREFLQEPRDKPLPPVYAVDERGGDILDRPIAPEILQQARALAARRAYPDALRGVSTADGRRYLLFTLSQAPLDAPPPDWRPGRPRSPPSVWPPILSGLLASLLFSAALAWSFAKPIRGLRDAFAAAARGDLKTRVAQSMVRRDDELADLGRDFDHMAAQLDSLISAQQRLLNDVSHELRSPLARMQAAIGLAQQQPDKMPDTLVRIERESQRISDLVGELLVLSRMEAGVNVDACSEIDLGGLLADIVEDARFEAAQQGVELHYEGFDDVIVKSRCELLQRAVENVLRNAVQHCKKGGEVSVSAEFDSANRSLRIVIDDQGPGVAEADLTAIFQPFYRGGKANRPDSIGLGLAIAHSAVTTLGGTLQAANRPEGGLRMAMEVAFGLP